MYSTNESSFRAPIKRNSLRTFGEEGAQREDPLERDVDGPKWKRRLSAVNSLTAEISAAISAIDIPCQLRNAPYRRLPCEFQQSVRERISYLSMDIFWTLNTVVPNVRLDCIRSITSVWNLWAFFFFFFFFCFCNNFFFFDHRAR